MLCDLSLFLLLLCCTFLSNNLSAYDFWGFVSFTRFAFNLSVLFLSVPYLFGRVQLGCISFSVLLFIISFAIILTGSFLGSPFSLVCWLSDICLYFYNIFYGINLLYLMYILLLFILFPFIIIKNILFSSITFCKNASLIEIASLTLLFLSVFVYV